jgi:predicted short-subunit dehydrogenase-like oxidoreductase (DUF2520 family)
MKPRIAVVGCGRVGTNLGRYLYQAGYPVVGLASRTLASAQRASRLSGNCPYGLLGPKMTASADVVFITTPDDAIAGVCSQMVAGVCLARSAMVLHCSGSQPSTILAAGGRPTGSLHPLQSVPAADAAPNPFKGAMMAVEGSPEAVSLAEVLAADLGGIAFRIRTAAKTLYHAAAVVASNYLVTLMDMALALLEAAGIDRGQAFEVMEPLVTGTLANIATRGTVQALTGPVARGDAGTVSQHIDAMARLAPQWLSLYRALGAATVDLARRQGLAEAVANSLQNLLATAAASKIQR